MQIKKEDIRQMILDAAKDEFAKRGYENTSMRILAKKANTSIGNIYHYFHNKEAILDALMLPEIEAMKLLVEQHIDLNVQIHSVDEINEMLKRVDLNSIELKALLCKEFVILMRNQVERYVKYREAFMTAFCRHLSWHMDTGEQEAHFIEIIANMLVECVIHLNMCEKCVTDKKEDFVKLLRMVCSGVIAAKDEEGK